MGRAPCNRGILASLCSCRGFIQPSPSLIHTKCAASSQELEKIIKDRLPANYNFNIALSFEEEFDSYHKEIKDFLRQVIRVTDIIKAENIATSEILAGAQQDQHQRVRDFYALAIPVIEQYQSYGINKSYLDFNDMITRTISLFKNHKEIADKYRKQFK